MISRESSRALARSAAIIILGLAPSWWLGCVEEDQGTSGGLQVALDVSAPAAPASFRAGNRTVSLQEATLSVVSVQLVPCPGTSSTRRTSAGVAHAHGEGSPLQVAVPVIVDLLRGTTHADVGRFEPPAGTYCRVTLEAGPADGDAVGLATSPDMAGHAALASGTVDGNAFDIADQQHRSATVDLLDEDGQPAPLRLASAADAPRLRVELGALQDLDAAAFTDARTLVESLLGRARAMVTP